jgi:hypothetical protein
MLAAASVVMKTGLVDENQNDSCLAANGMLMDIFRVENFFTERLGAAGGELFCTYRGYKMPRVQKFGSRLAMFF